MAFSSRPVWLCEFWTFTNNSPNWYLWKWSRRSCFCLGESEREERRRLICRNKTSLGRRRLSRDGWPLPASVGGLRSVCHARGAELQTHRRAHVFLWCYSVFARRRKLQVQRGSPSLSPWLRDVAVSFLAVLLLFADVANPILRWLSVSRMALIRVCWFIKKPEHRF